MAVRQDIVNPAPDDPSADTLYQVGNKINNNNQYYDDQDALKANIAGGNTLTGEQIIDDVTLAAIDELINSNTIVDVFIYDTTQDYDGGAWVDRVEHQPPKISVIVAESAKISIYDGTKHPLTLWNEYTPWTAPVNGDEWWRTGRLATSVDMLNGVLYITTYIAGGSSSGVSFIDFKNNTFGQHTDASGSGGLAYDISTMGTEVLDNSLEPIISGEANSIAIAQDAYGNNIVYVATDGGLSRIAPDGSVSNWDDNSGTVKIITALAIHDGYVYFAIDNSTAGKYIHAQPVNNELVNSAFNSTDYWHIATSNPVTWSSYKLAVHYNNTSLPVNVMTATDDEIIIGTDYSLTRIYPNPDNWGNSMYSNTTGGFYSGIMHGDIKGAFLANSKTADRSYNNNALTETGTITEIPVATGAELVYTTGYDSTNYIIQPYNSDLDFGTGTFYLMFWTENNAVNSFFNMRGRFTGASFGDGARIYSQSSSAPGTEVKFVTRDSTGNQSTYYSNTGTLTQSKWQLVTIIRLSDGTCLFYIDDKFAGADVQTVRDIDDSLCQYKPSSGYFTTHSSGNCNVTLSRIGAGQPSFEQIKRIYEEERVLFQENSKMLLQSSSTDCIDAAYSKDDNILAVQSADHITRFNGLSVVSDEASTATSIARSKLGMEITGV